MLYQFQSILVVARLNDEDLQKNKRYVAARRKSERNQHGEIVGNGSHSSQKALNALIWLNSSAGEINEPPRFGETIAGVLQIRRARWVG